MIKKLRDKFANMRGIADLCSLAEAIARNSGEVEPAAEHFLLASLEMKDGSAAQALSGFGVDRAALADAISEQHAAALDAAGISKEHVVEGEAVAGSSGTILFRASASGQQLMQILSQQASRRKAAGFRSAHVLEAAAAMRHGVVPRVLKKLGLSEQLQHTSQTAS